MSKVTRKTIALVAGGALVVAGAGAAYAYWTTSGTGTGTATTGTSTALIVRQTSVVTDLAPGGAAQELSGNFDNSGAPAYVATVTASIASITKAAGAVAGTCDATDYTLTNATMNVGAQVPTGTGVGSWGVPADVATIEFNNKGTTQDQCKGATVNLAYTIA
jgi:hypothetical protein